MICSSSGEKNKKVCEKELACCDLAISYSQMKHMHCTVSFSSSNITTNHNDNSILGASLGISPYIN